MLTRDDDLQRFAAQGLTLPAGGHAASLGHDGVQIGYTQYQQDGPAVILLHGGMGHRGNWGGQVPALIEAGYHVIAIDTRGHGSSTRDARPFNYTLLATDVLAVMDALRLDAAHLLGWSDGACTALVLADLAPARVKSVLFFACNMDPSGTCVFKMTNIIQRCLDRHRADYARYSTTPDQFDAFAEAVSYMHHHEPNYTAAELANIQVPVAVVHGEHDEFILQSHATYLAHTLPKAQFIFLPEVSHFAPIQHPAQFNQVLLDFLRSTTQASV